MKLEALSKTQRAMLASAINTFGSGQHPEANEDSLAFFERDYVRAVLVLAYSQARPVHRSDLDLLCLHFEVPVGNSPLDAASRETILSRAVRQRLIDRVRA